VRLNITLRFAAPRVGSSDLKTELRVWGEVGVPSLGYSRRKFQDENELERHRNSRNLPM
jgi:hypothetical protein